MHPLDGLTRFHHDNGGALPEPVVDAVPHSAVLGQDFRLCDVEGGFAKRDGDVAESVFFDEFGEDVFHGIALSGTIESEALPAEAPRNPLSGSGRCPGLGDGQSELGPVFHRDDKPSDVLRRSDACVFEGADRFDEVGQHAGFLGGAVESFPEFGLHDLVCAFVSHCIALSAPIEIAAVSAGNQPALS